MQTITKKSLLKLREFLFDLEQKVSAVIVVKSKRTGIDFTYGITAETKRGTRIISALIEIRYNTYKPVYHIFDFKTTKPKLETVANPNKTGAIWFLNNLVDNNIDKILEQCELFHIGRCLKCNRPLTDAESIEIGIGPVCRGEGREKEQEPYNRET